MAEKLDQRQTVDFRELVMSEVDSIGVLYAADTTAPKGYQWAAPMP
jgi:hypothetical protein